MISYWSEVSIQLVVAETSERATSCTMSAPRTLIVQISDLQRLADFPAGFKHGLHTCFIGVTMYLLKAMEIGYCPALEVPKCLLYIHGYQYLGTSRAYSSLEGCSNVAFDQI